jgi:hypothetical protein
MSGPEQAAEQPGNLGLTERTSNKRKKGETHRQKAAHKTAAFFLGEGSRSKYL